VCFFFNGPQYKIKQYTKAQIKYINIYFMCIKKVNFNFKAKMKDNFIL